MKLPLSCIFLILINLFSNSSYAQIPQIISFQGQIASGGSSYNGTGLFAFALVSTNGLTTYWSNDGTSVGGSKPVANISLNVNNGYYTILLGDTTVSNMISIPNSVFINSDVRLRIWFNDGIHGFQVMNPDQRITSVGYAYQASSLATGSTVPANYITGTLSTSQLPISTGTGNVVLSNAPILVSPNLGTPSYVNLTNATGITIAATNISGAILNNQLSNNSINFIAGSGLSGGGTVALGSSVSITSNLTSVAGRTGAVTLLSSDISDLGTIARKSAPSGTSSQLLANDGTGGFSNITVGTGLSLSGQTLSAVSATPSPSTYVCQARVAYQTIAYNADVLVPYRSTDTGTGNVSDPNGWWNNSTSTFSPSISGYYNIFYKIYGHINYGNEYINLKSYLNDVVNDIVGTNGSYYHIVSNSYIIYLSAGDKIKIKVSVSDGGRSPTDTFELYGGSFSAFLIH